MHAREYSQTEQADGTMAAPYGSDEARREKNLSVTAEPCQLPLGRGA